MAQLDWDWVRMELTGAWQRRPVSGKSIVAGQGGVSPTDAHRSTTVPDSDGTNIDPDALLEHIAMALADCADESY